MENIAHKLSEKIAEQMNYDEDKKAIIAYGLIAFFQILVILSIISIIGLLGRFWYESLIIFFGVGILKKSTGGAHAQTIWGCTIISVLSITLFAMLSRYVLYYPINTYINYGMTLFVFVLCAVIFYKYVPVDSPNKPIKKPEKIKRLRQQSFILLTIYTVLSCVFIVLGTENQRFNSLAFSIHFVLLWQAFMLTKSGMRLISRSDTKSNVKEV